MNEDKLGSRSGVVLSMKVVAADSLYVGMPVEIIEQHDLVHHAVTRIIMNIRKSIAELPFKREVERHSGILENMMMQNDVPHRLPQHSSK